MATSGNKSVAVGSHNTLKFTWSVSSQSVAANTSKVSWKLQLIADAYGAISSSASKDYSVTVNGTKYSGTNKIGISNNATITLASGTTTIAHDADGKKAFSYSFSQEIAATLGGSYIGTKSGSGSGTLDTIPREATLLTAPNFSDTDNPIITYSNPAGDAVTSLEVAIYNADGTQSYVPYKDDISKTGSSYTFNLSEGERDNLRRATADSNSIPVRFYIRTTIGDNTYLSYLERTLTINDANPKITASVVDINEKTIALTDDNKKLIKYYSNAKATMSAEAQKGAAIDESLYIIRNGDNSGYGTEHTFEKVESNRFVFSAEDSRGNIETATLTPTMVEYTKLTCHLGNNRPDALGNMTISCSGSFFNGSFGAVENTLNVQYRYGLYGTELSDDDWIDMSVTKSGNSYRATSDIEIPDFNQQLYYTFETRATDKLETISSTDSVKSLPVFHWGENDFVFEVPVTFNGGIDGAIGETDTFDGSKTITGNLRLKGKNSNYGNFLLFGDKDYCYITEPIDDEMMIHANKLHLDASGGVFIDGYAIPILEEGIWTPTLNSSVISSYSTQYGWYSKMGQSVTIGFYIKATCKTGYQSTSISISGMPFTPMHPAAGGGMCSGAYVAANQNFQCYVAETSKTITVRTQACNNSSAANLTTSASGCFYRSSGGEITLSGTISFIANV